MAAKVTKVIVTGTGCDNANRSVMEHTCKTYKKDSRPLEPPLPRCGGGQKGLRGPPTPRNNFSGAIAPLTWSTLVLSLQNDLLCYPIQGHEGWSPFSPLSR